MNLANAALLFPGQGAHDAQMITLIRSLPMYNEYYDEIRRALGWDPIRRIVEGETSVVNENAVSSLLTVLCSVLLLDQFRKTHPTVNVVGMAGYSVGQWTALYAAGSISYPQLVNVLAKRATLMDFCSASTPGAMMAVIGVSVEVLERFCKDLSSNGYSVSISNYNCFGQYTLSGDVDSIEYALEKVRVLAPKKAVRLPTSGAWHSPLMEAARQSFFGVIQDLDFAPCSVPVVDNVTGGILPRSRIELTATLCAQISAPVQWEAGILALLSMGCTEFLEMGYGNVLTKFGFFIDRSVKHSSFSPTIVRS